MYFHASTLLADREFLARANPERRQSLRSTIRGLAYVFAVNRDGWERFCSGWQIDPRQLLEVLPGYRAGVLRRGDPGRGLLGRRGRGLARRGAPGEWVGAGRHGGGRGRVDGGVRPAASRLLGHKGELNHEPERDGRLRTATQAGADAAAAERGRSAGRRQERHGDGGAAEAIADLRDQVAAVRPDIPGRVEPAPGGGLGAGLDRLRSLIPQALDVLAAGLSSRFPPRQFKAAVEVLRLARLPAASLGIGPTDAEEIVRGIVSERRQKAPGTIDDTLEYRKGLPPLKQQVAETWQELEALANSPDEPGDPSK